MNCLSPLLAILEDPAARVLFVLDTSASTSGTSLPEEFFDYLRLLRARADPSGARTVAITDRFAASRLTHEVEPEVLPLSCRVEADIPPGQLNVGGTYNPLECVGSVGLFHSYAPTHGVFVSDLYDSPPAIGKMAFLPDKAIFLLWDASPENLARAEATFGAAGRVLPLFAPHERQYLLTCENADLLAAHTPARAPGERRRRI